MILILSQNIFKYSNPKTNMLENILTLVQNAQAKV
jgi:hypothetical protein